MRIRHDQIEGNGMHLVGSQLGAPQNKTDLRTVAMRDDDPPTLLDEPRDVLAGLAHGIPLIAHLAALVALNQRVASDGNDGDLAGHRARPLGFACEAITDSVFALDVSRCFGIRLDFAA